MTKPALTLDELIDWLVKLRKGNEGAAPTNITDIAVYQPPVGPRHVTLITR